MSDMIELPPTEDLGPAMRALKTDGHRRFVMALMEQADGFNWQRAYLAAYPGVTLGTAKVNGHHLSRREDIQAAFHEECVRLLHSGKIKGVQALLDIVADKTHKDHFKATNALLNRVGFHEITEQRIDVRKHITIEDKRARIEELSRQLGKDPREFLTGLANLPALPPPVDVEFVEIGSTEGLEDVL